MPDTVLELIKTLDELSEVLESDGDLHWSSWMRKAADKLRIGDASGVDYLLRAYGGMGSLNDLILGQTYVNGSFAWKPNHVAMNERFELLRSRAWQLAQNIRRTNPSPHRPSGSEKQ